MPQGRRADAAGQAGWCRRAGGSMPQGRGMAGGLMPQGCGMAGGLMPQGRRGGAAGRTQSGASGREKAVLESEVGGVLVGAEGDGEEACEEGQHERLQDGQAEREGGRPERGQLAEDAVAHHPAQDQDERSERLREEM